MRGLLPAFARVAQPRRPALRLVFVPITERLSDVKKEVMTTDRFDFDLTTRRSQRTSTEAKAEEEEKEVESATRKDEREYKPKSFKTVKMIFVGIFIFVALILVIILVASLISSKMRPQSKQPPAVSAVRMPAADTQSNGL
ncbi:hypothetical protein M3Y99_00729900 [Aphelenchoides fujianensis]|nr:hypothetical protein M3Y99_00729900 [Aphelenchoides fujianensis]